MNDERLHIVVEGLVQGVGFRWFAHRKAESMGIRGWVRNLYNGSVEIEAEADRAMLEAFITELRTGPRSAHVTNMKIEQKQHVPGEYRIFEIR